MRPRKSLVLATVAVWLLAGCGEGSGRRSSIQTPAAVVPTSGNWAFPPAVLSSVGLVTSQPFIGGSLVANGDAISTDFLVLPVFPSCPMGEDSLDATLTAQVKGSQMTLTSAPWNNGVFTVTAQVAADGNSFSGDWSVKGGCGDGVSGLLAGSFIPNVTGTWAGALTPEPGKSSTPLTGASVTLQMAQALTPNRYSYPLSGTLTISGSTCGLLSGTLMQVPVGYPSAPSSISGYNWTAEAQMSDGRSLVIAVGVMNPSIPGSWVMELGVSGGTCDGAMGSATLARQ